MKAEREPDEDRRRQEHAAAERIRKENAGRAVELLRGRLSDDELVTFRNLHEASGYEFRNVLERWEPELTGPASIELPPLERTVPVLQGSA